MNSRLLKCRDWLSAQAGRKQTFEEEVARLDGLLLKAKGELTELDRARTVVNEVQNLTYDALRRYVEEVVSLALSTVYGPRYGFDLDLEIKRGQSEAVPWITKGGDRFSPRNEVGGGVLDVASVAFRLALWSIREPKSAPVFVLDEPARFLSRDKQEMFGEVLKKLSTMLGLQILMVSHSDGIITQADRAWAVSQAKGISKVELIA